MGGELYIALHICKFASVQCTDLSKIHVRAVQKSRLYLISFSRSVDFYLWVESRRYILAK